MRIVLTYFFAYSSSGGFSAWGAACSARGAGFSLGTTAADTTVKRARLRFGFALSLLPASFHMGKFLGKSIVSSSVAQSCGAHTWKSSGILYPSGKKVLNPKIRRRSPLKRSETRSMTPGVFMLHSAWWQGELTQKTGKARPQARAHSLDWKSFMMSRNWSYTSLLFSNFCLTWRDRGATE